MLTKLNIRVKPHHEKPYDRAVCLAIAIGAIVATFIIEYFHYIVR